ncbi:FAD dependent oxidoreductase [Xylariaceae sp. FL1272]|nr:FAD dependent oxidoreductase [Xylariaceae sp. FL1272]
MPDTQKSTIVVIGAGIIGLTSALTIQSQLIKQGQDTANRYEILIVARDWPDGVAGGPFHTSVDYASMWGGAHVRPVPADTPQLRQEAVWLKKTVAELDRQSASEPWLGISKTLGREYLEAPPPSYLRQDAKSFVKESGLPGYRTLPPAELPSGVTLGFEYQTYCVNPPLYCTNLLRKFIRQGGKTLHRTLRSTAEAFDLASDVALVVNASGIGFGDPKVFPMRGQTVLTNIENPVATVTRQNKDGSWNFIIPRAFDGGTIVGGTKEPNDWRTEPSLDVRTTLLSALPLLDPETARRTEGGGVGVIKDIVGRRPTREGGVRLEVESVRVEYGAVRGGARVQPVVHAYGAGGRGYEISWGVAEDVGKLVLDCLTSSGSGAGHRKIRARL